MEERKETEGRRRQENRNRRRRQKNAHFHHPFFLSLPLLMRYHHRRTAQDTSTLLIDARAANVSSTLLTSCSAPSGHLSQGQRQLSTHYGLDFPSRRAGWHAQCSTCVISDQPGRVRTVSFPTLCARAQTSHALRYPWCNQGTNAWSNPVCHLRTVADGLMDGLWSLSQGQRVMPRRRGIKSPNYN